MTTQAKHTPLPWCIDKNAASVASGDGIDIMSGMEVVACVFTEAMLDRGYEVARPGETVSCEWAYRKATPEERANAAFIVRACNSHEALVEACKALVTLAQNVKELEVDWPGLDDVDEQARAALAKAQE